jgi:SPP1 gp7 family putative phage head morphogenesis protein
MAERNVARLKDWIAGGILAGEGYEEIAKGVRAQAGGELWDAKRLVRTETTAAATEGAMEMMREAGVERYRFIVSLDDKTCGACGPLDGRLFLLEDARDGVNRPPIHPHCRCTVAAAFEGEDLSRAQRRGRVLDPETGKMRSELLPADVTYEQWKREYASGGRFKTVNDYGGELGGFVKLEKHPSQKQLASITAYQEDHRPFNMAMRGYAPMTPEIKAHVENLENAAERIRIKEDIRLMRGTRITEAYPAPEVGETIDDGAFISTSTDYGVAERYSKGGDMGGVVTFIDVPKGTRALPGSYLTGYKEDEKEIFLLPHQEIYIKKVVKPSVKGEPYLAYAEAVPSRRKATRRK